MATPDDDAVSRTLVTDREPASVSPGVRLELLVVGEGVVQGIRSLPTSGEIVIGRTPGCDLEINHPSISRRHALLRLGPPITIEDLGSSNGTRVAGKRLETGVPAELHPWTVIDIGAVMLVIQQMAGGERVRRIWNHGYFEGRLEDECARAKRDGSAFAVLLVRVEAGSPALVREALVDGVRGCDAIGAYSPQAHEVLLVGADAHSADLVVRRLEQEILRRGCQVRIGCAVYPQDGLTPDALLERALAALAVTSSGLDERSPLAPDVMQPIFRLLERVAQGSLNVLLLGETGVGKEVLAHKVHRLSPRAEKPYLRLNCAALHESLLESELFGHERGAFTGAVQTKPGLLETAEGGTVFLDEVGEMSLNIQARLLRVIESREVLRVGGLKAHDVDVRFVSATNRDLEAEMIRGTFRRDLYYRLAGVTLVVPPLRERALEIPQLLQAFLPEAARKAGRDTAPELASEALSLLLGYAWPGNIRELRNVIERAVLLCQGSIITVEHLPLEKLRTQVVVAAPSAAPTQTAESANSIASARSHSSFPDEATVPGSDTILRIQRDVAESDRRRVLDALTQAGGNQSRAAQVLGISRQALVKKLDKHGILRPRKSRGKIEP